ncbi:MAG: 7-carboxy-7-deazaguanine synthase QueE [Nitrococcus mobilis]|nr:7-carboxy-7-deazaguanine synthase QueE [Nitrococcus mobilis]
MQPRPDALRVTEIFYSLQGEASTVGAPTVFVRLTGCPLRCQYCDTAYAFHGGEKMSIIRILERVGEHTAKFVTVTGGEPLAQRGCLTLLGLLCDRGYRVSLETSGAFDVQAVDPRVVKVMDLKTPASGEVRRNRWENLNYLRPHDELKFVICNRQDYDWARVKVNELKLGERWTVFFSASYGELSSRLLADWILADRLNVRLQIQLHKYLWGDQPGR